ncbi:TnsA endonuclease C-terminal domain-containing protein [Xylanivirga thermophila]|uniref:TnsA endonuclease C-terminal domain-containing protein n=1 Tax=Xylanivirga thermophila TaxID=2496273 RepID=UPI00101BBBBA|nr:TnsA endonuclease C-terminal domain-containing protein [Xylanivirga thermophila]
MAKKNAGWNEDKLNRWIKEGRGQGEGRDYKPWITVTDFPSQGRCARVKGIKTGRVHHFLSDIQREYFYLLEFDEANIIFDIKESYPLLDFYDVVQDTQDLNKQYFKDKNTGLPYVLTTTFLITIKSLNGGVEYVARSVKAASELERKTTLEKLEMERRYWQAKSIDWSIVTEKDINSVKAKNIEWALSSIHAIPDMGLSKQEIIELGAALQLRLYSNKDSSIRSIVTGLEVDYALDEGTGLFLFRYLVAIKAVRLNMNIPIDLSSPASVIKFDEIMEEDLKSVSS